MNRNSIRKLASWVLVLMVAMFTHLPGAAAAPPAQAADGFQALSEAEAAGFVLPGDVRLVRDLALGNGLRYERQQQYFGEAAVLGAQISVYRDGSGTAATVIGAHYSNILPTNTVSRSRNDAAAVAQRDVCAGEGRSMSLLIDPASGRYFYQVETRALDCAGPTRPKTPGRRLA